MIKRDRAKDLKIIWAKARDLGIDRDVLHTLNLELNGLESIAALDAVQRRKLIRDLYSKGQCPGPRHGGRLIRGDQQLIIQGFISKLGWSDRRTFQAFCLRVIRKPAPGTFTEAGSIIQALKSLIRKSYGSVQTAKNI